MTPAQSSWKKDRKVENRLPLLLRSQCLPMWLRGSPQQLGVRLGVGKDNEGAQEPREGCASPKSSKFPLQGCLRVSSTRASYRDSGVCGWVRELGGQLPGRGRQTNPFRGKELD